MKRLQFYTIVILQKIGYCLFFILYKIFARLEIVGRENLIGLSGPVILASNHTSELDATALPLVLPIFSPFHPVYFVTNTKEKFKTFGWRSYLYCNGFLTLLGGYPIYSGYKDYATALERHIKLLKERHTVCIFPEGRRTRDGQLGVTHGGLGYLVYTSGATVLPIAINTFFNMSWYEFWRGRRKVTIKIGKPMRADEVISPKIKHPQVDDFRHASQKVLDKIKETMH